MNPSTNSPDTGRGAELNPAVDYRESPVGASGKPRRVLVERLIALSRWPLLGKYVYYFNIMMGFDIPPQVKIGKQFRLEHMGLGVVVHPMTTIGDRVLIFSGVTLGRADSYRRTETEFEGIVIEDDVVIGTGAKVLCKRGVLRVGRGTVIGANAVLLESTGEFEVWAGIPAKRIKQREMSGARIGDPGYE